MRIFTLIITLFILVACENKPPVLYTDQKECISDQDMTLLLQEMFKIKGAYNILLAKDSQATAKALASYDSLFQAHQVDKEQFDQQFRILLNQPERFDNILSHVIENLNKEKDALD